MTADAIAVILFDMRELFIVGDKVFGEGGDGIYDVVVIVQRNEAEVEDALCVSFE